MLYANMKWIQINSYQCIEAQAETLEEGAD